MLFRQRNSIINSVCFEKLKASVKTSLGSAAHVRVAVYDNLLVGVLITLGWRGEKELSEGSHHYYLPFRFCL